MTEDGLEDQLLALTVSKERPDLEEQKAGIIQSTNDNKIKIKALEDGILEQLANAEGDVLENIELIENLEDSKRVSTEIAEKMAVAVETEKKINISRENYRKVAGRGSLMFFLLSDLNKMHTFQCGAESRSHDLWVGPLPRLALSALSLTQRSMDRHSSPQPSSARSSRECSTSSKS